MILARYSLRGITARLFVALPATALIYWSFDVTDRGRAHAEQIGWSATLAASLLHLPLIAVLVLPAALLLSITMWLSRLRTHGELEAAACLGRGPGIVAPPLLLLGALCAAAAFATNELLVPPSERAADVITAGARSALTGLSPPQPWRRQGAWFLHRQAGPGPEKLLAIELDDRAAIRQRIEGALFAASPLSIRRARHWRFGEKGFTSRGRTAMRLPSAWAAAPQQPLRAEATSFAGLYQALASGAAAGRQRRIDQLVLHSKLAFPLLNLVVAAAGVGFAFGSRRRSPVIDLLAAAGFLVFVWALFAGGWALCRSGLIGPFAGAWSPLGLAAALAAGSIALPATRSRRGSRSTASPLPPRQENER